MLPGLESAWLAARRPFDEAALDRRAILAIRRWSADHRHGDPLRVVDLGSATGSALQRALPWLGDRVSTAFAVETDGPLLAAAPVAWRERGWTVDPIDGSLDVGGAPYAVVRDRHRATVNPLGADALAPFDAAGGPPDGSLDLVLAHAFADLAPLDRLAARVRALLRPGGLAHLALTYDGETVFEPVDDARLEARVLAAYHRHMDIARATSASYGGSTAGRRLAPALEAAGLRILQAAPSIWRVRLQPGDNRARELLGHMIRFVVDSLNELDEPTSEEVARWEGSRRASLDAGRLSLRVRHTDLLATRPTP